jgi:hypothetical protein
MERYERDVLPVRRDPLYCVRCRGLLLPSTYGGFMHAYDRDDTHTPVAPRGAENPIGPPRKGFLRRLLGRWR